MGRNWVHCVQGVRNTRFIYNSNSLKDYLRFLTENAYYRIGNLLFQQLISGIPLGCDPAPLFINLFLIFH